MKTSPDNKNIVSVKDTIPGKITYWIDSKTDFLHNIETDRAEWLMKEFPIHKWTADSERIHSARSFQLS